MPKKGSTVVLVLEKNRDVKRMFCLFCNESTIRTKIVSTAKEAAQAIKEYDVRAIAFDGCLLEKEVKINTQENLKWVDNVRKNFNGPIIVMLCMEMCNCKQELLNMTANNGFILCKKENLDEVLKEMLEIYSPKKAYH